MPTWSPWKEIEYPMFRSLFALLGRLSSSQSWSVSSKVSSPMLASRTIQRHSAFLLLSPAESGVCVHRNPSEMCYNSLLLVLCALPWFFLEKRRPGLKLPAGSLMLTIGIKQTVIAFRECMRLKQTFLYLIFYFLMYVPFLQSSSTWLTSCCRGDVLNTTV